MKYAGSRQRSAAALLVRDPSRFDLVLATNFYGDILSDETTIRDGLDTCD